MYNYERDTWRILPPMKNTRRAAQCGLAQWKDPDTGLTVREVIVAGGEDGTYDYQVVCHVGLLLGPSRQMPRKK